MQPASRLHGERHIRAGAALLEVIIAFTILSIAGVSALTAASESANAVRRAREADRAMQAASGFFDAVALWTRDDLNRHLGDRAQGPWRMAVSRPTAALYVVTLTDSATHVELLRTSLFRPDTTHATP